MNFIKQICIAICMITSVTVPTCAGTQQSPSAVLIIDDGDRDSIFSRRVRQQIHTTLDATTAQSYSVYTEFLDRQHFSSRDNETLLRDYLINKYRNKPISVIVTLGAESLRFAGQMRAEMRPTPVVVFAKFDSSSTTASFISQNITGVIVHRPFSDLVKAARLLVPHLMQLALVAPPVGHRPFRSNYQRETRAFGGDVTIIDLTGLPIAAVERRVATLADNTAVVYLPLYSDKAGTIHNPAEALRKIAKVANRPIVVDSTSFIGMGATGGFVTSARDLGREIGHRVARILDGKSASSIPIAVEDLARPIFDARELKRWDISAKTFPADTELRFQEVGIWDRYRWPIMAAAAILLFQGLAIALLVVERRRRLAAQHESQQNLLAASKMDRAMTVSALSSSIAHELNQPLGAILNNAEVAEILLNSDVLDRDQLKEIVADIRYDDQRAADIIKHLRVLLKKGNIELQDTILADLIDETVELIKPQATERGVIVQVEPPPQALRVRADRVHIQQVLLNLMLNALDAMQNVPAGERMLRLRAKRRLRDVLVSVSDSGWGIPVDKLRSIFQPFVTTKGDGTGLGLSISQTIVAAHGGKIWAENGATRGSTFYFTLRPASAKMARHRQQRLRIWKRRTTNAGSFRSPVL